VIWKPEYYRVFGKRKKIVIWILEDYGLCQMQSISPGVNLKLDFQVNYFHNKKSRNLPSREGHVIG